MPKINKGHYPELTDRIYIAQENLHNNIGDHPLMKKHKKWKKKFDKAQGILFGIYQKCGAKS